MLYDTKDKMNQGLNEKMDEDPLYIYHLMDCMNKNDYGQCRESLLNFMKHYLVGFKYKQDNIKQHILYRQELFNNTLNNTFSDILYNNPQYFDFYHYGLSNLLGNYKYTHGKIVVSTKDNDSLNKNNTREDDYAISDYPINILSAIPARHKFPRAFLWDEGFHLLVVQRFSLLLFLNSFQFWMNLQFHIESNNYLKSITSRDLSKYNGWIPREIIVDVDLSDIPHEFIPQHLTVANPPALLIPILYYIDAVNELIYYLNHRPFYSMNKRGFHFIQAVYNDIIYGKYKSIRYLKKLLNDFLKFKLKTYIDIPLNNIYNFTPSDQIYFFQIHHCLIDNYHIFSLIEIYLDFLDKQYPNILKWFDYFVSAQTSLKKGKIMNTSEFIEPLLFQWKSAESKFNYPSGLDDYPRGSYIDPMETHIDLQSWMGYFAYVGFSLTKLLVNAYPKTHLMSTDNLFWKNIYKVIVYPMFLPYTQNIIDNKDNLYNPIYASNHFQYILTDNLGEEMRFNEYNETTQCTYIENNKKKNCCNLHGWCNNIENIECEKCITDKYKEREKLNKASLIFNEDIRSNQFGYINLFPFALGLLKSKIITMAHDLYDDLDDKGKIYQEKCMNHLLFRMKELLLTPYGLRSLSNTSSFYHTEQDYWRGDIWIPINYLVLYGLSNIYMELNSFINKTDNIIHIMDDINQLYILLSERVRKTVYDGFIQNYTFFERYSDYNGKGKGVVGFTGWTTTALLISDNINI